MGDGFGMHLAVRRFAAGICSVQVAPQVAVAYQQLTSRLCSVTGNPICLSWQCCGSRVFGVERPRLTSATGCRLDVPAH
jgi:hypothetical protein